MNIKKHIKLFCDASVNPQKKIGFGAYFTFEECDDYESVKSKIKLKKFIETSSTKLEVETLLWAFEDEFLKDKEITVYTDCQNVLGLESRREKLEKTNYLTSTGKVIKNKELYKKFYFYLDNLELKFQKVKGHKKSSLKDEIDDLFNLVDKASRKALREYLKKDIS